MNDKKIKFIFFADSHLGFDYPVKPRIERRRRGTDFFNNYIKILNYAAENKADLVLHGGDFFFRTRVPSKIIDLSYQILLEFAGKGIPFVIVPGNHERSKLPMSIFLGHPNIFVFENPNTFNFEIKSAKISIAGFPCERNNIREKFLPTINKMICQMEADIKLLLLHQTFEGSSVKNYTFRQGPDVVSFSDIPAFFDAVLSGHIHRRQILVKEFPEKRIPIIYPGSIERTSFQEMDEVKGFYEIIYSEGQDSKWKMKELNFINLPARPMKDLIIDETTTAENLKAYVDSKISEMPADSIVRILFSKTADKGLKNLFTSSLLKNIIPPTMNYQFGSGIFDFYRKD